ncbi:hypothetical protein [Streptomyces sp. NPDC006879]|uniref:hypothetical protein n=1 Tax=Streptomyces sp. NPDC006879 TaxID=3364767 RepID=UPI0036B3D0BE
MSGPLWLTPPDDPGGPHGPVHGCDTLALIPRQRRTGGPAEDPLEELTERLAHPAAAAVHPDEIAALLESDGMTDEHIRLTYGREDSFGLAEEIYAKVPRSYPDPSRTVPDPWRVSLIACLLRGLVFVLPGLAYVLAGPLLEGPPDRFGLPSGTLALVAAALVGWIWDQTLSHRAYSWLGVGDRWGAGRTLLVGAPVGALLGTVAALCVPGPPFPVFHASGQALYVGAATVLLVLGRERVLVVALLPMAGGAVLALTFGMPLWARVVLLLGSLSAACVLAVRELPVREVLRRGAGHLRRSCRSVRPAAESVHWQVLRAASESPAVRGPRLRESLPYGLFGLSSGVLVLHVALGEVLAGGPSAALAAPSAVALTLSMGPAEWLLNRFRSGSLAGLRAARTAAAFRRTLVLTLARCLLGYLTVLLTFGTAATLVWPDAPALGGLRLAALLLVGAVMWTGLLLQSFGQVRVAAAVCACAGLAQSAVLFTGVEHPHALQVTISAGAAGLLALLACLLLGRVSAHR